jgi:replicative DNA helicase
MANVPQALELPIDANNECIVLSNAIKNSSNRDMFLRKINFLDFRYKEHQVVAWAIKSASDAKMLINEDAIVLKSRTCPVRYTIDFEFLQLLIQNYPELPKSNYEEHLKKLSLDKIKSELAETFHKSIYTACLNPTSDLEFLAERMKNVNAILEKGYSYSQAQFKPMRQVVDEYKIYRKQSKGLYTTGFRQLDEKLTEGLKPKGITIVAGLPGAGKSSFTLSMMNNLANLHTYTAQFALEMDNNALTTKLAAFHSRISVKDILKSFDKLDPEKTKILEYELERLANNKYILLNDTPTQNLISIREQIMILQDHLQQEYIVIVIDLFGKIRDFQDSENFARDYEKKLNNVQLIAKETGVNIVPVAQINREVVGRKFNRPKMSDIKNASAWEEVADLILAIHRPWYNPEVALKKQIAENEYKYGKGEESEDYSDSDEDDQGDPMESLAELTILKQRMGETNQIINFYFDKLTTRYSPIVEEYQGDINAEKGTNFTDIPI